ncbi:MAG: gamma-glutamyltransferase, partial [Woeseiaceae bacterium]|nr:gamma-glutamyltransferase [Woeseiaceae bacterium]
MTLSTVLTAAQYRNGIVASGNPLATTVGVEVLKAGGNAIDAAVAVAFALNVTEPHNSGIGGGCFLLIRRANGEFVAIDGREMAPGKATRDLYLRGGKADTRLSQTGALASGVPGALAAYSYALTNFGTLQIKAAVKPAADLAEKGFVMTAHLAGRFRATAKKIGQFQGTRDAIWQGKTKLPVAGVQFRQNDLARSLHAIGEEGVDWFYRGPFARNTAKWMEKNGGIMTREDFAHYRVGLRQPIRGTYRGHEIVSFPPPSSGGVHVVQILNILENFDLAARRDDVAWRQHVIAEAMKLAFADRAHWLGDPD